METITARPPLTHKQRDVLDYIRAYIARMGYPPSFADIGTAFGVGTTNAVANHLKALAAKGYITRLAGRARAITIVDGPIPDDERDPSTSPWACWQRGERIVLKVPKDGITAGQARLLVRELKDILEEMS